MFVNEGAVIMYNQDNKSLIQEAARFLRTKTSDESLSQIRAEYKQNKEEFILRNHFSLGLNVRNVLRNGGFTDDKFGADLDDVWAEIVIEMLQQENDQDKNHSCM